MFWRKSESSPSQQIARVTGVSTPARAVSTPAKAGAASASAIAVGEFDRALDTVGALLSAYGEFAFDTDRSTAQATKDSCENHWREVALGPSKSVDEESRGSKRDYSKMLRFFEDQRRHEQQYVVRGIGNLRGAVQEFAQCLTAAVSEDRHTDQQIDNQLTRLVKIVTSNDLEAVRRETDRVVSLVRTAIARRRDREKEQLVHLGTQVQALRNELDAVRTQATLDALTQLFNRAAFDQEIDKVATLGLLLGSEPCLVMVDADRFKDINDLHGHPVGDEVLRAIADNLVRHFLRKEDFVCRFGGEEFAIVVRDSTLEKVAARVERARETMANSDVVTAAGPVKVTFSAGVSPLIHGEGAAQWIQRADRALYAAKHQGRNRVVILSKETEVESSDATQ
jgi:diguanylate cyclase